MSSSDPVEWRLYSSNLTTQLCVLPFKTSHIYMQNNDPGSGEVQIPLDSLAAPQVAIGQLCVMYYRGAQRSSFFVDNLKYVDIDANEGGGRMLSMSGRGAMELLEDSIMYGDGTTATSRTFTSMTKASILKTLIDEAQARGELATLAYSFTASVDSSSVAWTDSENYTLQVGTSLLDIARQFAMTGSFDFTLTFSGGIFTLNAYKNGRGSDKSTTMYFRVGSNCEEVGRDERGDEIFNVYLVKYQGGYITVSDSASISTYGRRVKYLNLEQAQSSASATTYASAQLAITKNPKANKTVKVYDGINPRLFVDYDLGDTVTLDRFGTQTTDKILGIQADFDESGAGFANIVIDFNIIQYNNQMKITSQLNDLLNQWNSAHDGNLLEVREGISIGGTNGAVNAVHNYGDYIYIGGAFTFVGSLASSKTARYQLSTHTWTALTGISATVIKIIDVSGTIYCITTDHVYVLSGTTWSSVGTATGTLRSMTTDGTDLYVGGSLTVIDAVTINHKVAKRHAGTWSDVDSNPNIYYTESMEWFNGTLFRGSGDGVSSALQYLSGGAFANALGDILDGKWIFGLKKVGSNLIIMANDNDGSSAATCTIYSWDGVSSGPGAGSAVVIGSITDFLPVATGVGNGSCAISNYLTDIYLGADFDTISGVTGFKGVAKYSGGIWSYLQSGSSSGVSNASGDGVTTIEVVNTDVYIGGIFTTAFGITVTDLAGFITDFQSLMDNLANGQIYNYDLGGAIHAAAASAVTDNDEFPFWEDVSAALRKITWANIKATLKTYFDTLYLAFGPVKLTNDISPTSLSADQNDYNPTNLATADVLRLTSSADVHITGLQGGADGRVIVLYNIGSNKIYLDNQNGGSSASNRFSIHADTTLFGDAGSITLIYDSTDSRWKPINFVPQGFDANIQDIGATAAAGTNTSWARGDHVHAGPKVETNANNMFRVSGVPSSAFSGTINGTPSGTSVVYNAGFTGSDLNLVPASTSQLAKLVLYNTTRSNSALISNCVTGTKTITLTAAVPANWANGDTITIASTTVSGGTGNWVDLKITSGPTGKNYIFMNLIFIDSGTVTSTTVARVHPTEAFSASKSVALSAQVSTFSATAFALVKITSDIFTVSWIPSGATSGDFTLREAGYIS